MAINVRIVVRNREKAVSFDDFEDGIHLNNLIEGIASALGTVAHRPKGSSLEMLIGFAGYPDEFALWWDGFTCELGCTAACGVDMDQISGRLVASGAFALA